MQLMPSRRLLPKVRGWSRKILHLMEDRLLERRRWWMIVVHEHGEMWLMESRRYRRIRWLVEAD